MAEITPNSLVSVIIIFLNAADFLREAIESVLAQTYEHWELLLVDDGSDDSSSELARYYASEYALQIHYFEHEGHQNLGRLNFQYLFLEVDLLIFLEPQHNPR